jgi:hypothetical protein
MRMKSEPVPNPAPEPRRTIVDWLALTLLMIAADQDVRVLEALAATLVRQAAQARRSLALVLSDLAPTPFPGAAAIEDSARSWSCAAASRAAPFMAVWSIRHPVPWRFIGSAKAHPGHKGRCPWRSSGRSCSTATSMPCSPPAPTPGARPQPAADSPRPAPNGRSVSAFVSDRGTAYHRLARARGRPPVKKFLNQVDDMLAESLRGFADAHPGLVVLHMEPTFVRRADAPVGGKVALISGGGSGHEPLHAGFVGPGMLDAACPGQVFTSPTPDQMLAAAEAVGGDAGVLFVV